MFNLSKQVTTEDYKPGTLAKIKPKGSPDWEKAEFIHPTRIKPMFDMLGIIIGEIPGSFGEAYWVNHYIGPRCSYWVDEIIICINRPIVE